MPALTIHDLPAETHQALKALAEKHGRSPEAEARSILEEAARPADRVKLGSLLAGIWHESRLSSEEQQLFDTAITRDRTPARPIDLDG